MKCRIFVTKCLSGRYSVLSIISLSYRPITYPPPLHSVQNGPQGITQAAQRILPSFVLLNVKNPSIYAALRAFEKPSHKLCLKRCHFFVTKK